VSGGGALGGAAGVVAVACVFPRLAAVDDTGAAGAWADGAVVAGGVATRSGGAEGAEAIEEGCITRGGPGTGGGPCALLASAFATAASAETGGTTAGAGVLTSAECCGAAGGGST